MDRMNRREREIAESQEFEALASRFPVSAQAAIVNVAERLCGNCVSDPATDS